ncbi:hypothetical protein J7K41_00085 [Candidatus Micrarchaeota archaeon]|nr:hypothetical protein [Candidatus Micrarchaeota archaeon]
MGLKIRIKKQGKTGKKPQIVNEPRVDGFELEGHLKTSIENLKNKLSTVSHLDVIPYREGVAVINIETRDIKKRPYLFSIIYFLRDRVRVIYSIVPGMSPKRRRLSIASYFLNLLTLVGDDYEVPLKQLYMFLEDMIKSMTEYVSSDYDKLFAQHDMLKEELEQLKKEIARLKESNEMLSRENYNLKRKLEDVTAALNALKKISDKTLAVKIQEWIAEHDGSIDVTEFAKVYGVSEARVEQVLNYLVTNGYLELK